MTSTLIDFISWHRVILPIEGMSYAIPSLRVIDRFVLSGRLYVGPRPL